MRFALHKVNKRPTARVRVATPKHFDRMATRRTQLQLLWDLADATLGGTHLPTPQQLEALRHALSLVPLSELGVMQPLPATGLSESPGSPPAHATSKQITYLHIYEDSNFSLGIFCLPAAARIPLHNHPGMSVISRVLYGTMHVTSYDWVDASRPEAGATLVHDRPFTARDAPTALFPSAGGNIHQFTAVTDCAVLDLLSPPYATEQGRDCTYYRPVMAPIGGVVLQEYDPPDDFVIASEDYRGVRVAAPSGRSSADGGCPAPREDSVGWSSAGSGSPRSETPPPDAVGRTPPDVVVSTAELASKFEASHLGGVTPPPLRNECN